MPHTIMGAFSMINPTKHLLIHTLLREHPELSNRAIARLADGVSPHTVARVKGDIKKHQPTLAPWEASPVVYRCYGKRPRWRGKAPLLYVGRTMDLAGCIAADSIKKPWWREVATIKLKHFSTVRLAEFEEDRAICLEQPKYNPVRPVPPEIQQLMEKRQSATRTQRRQRRETDMPTQPPQLPMQQITDALRKQAEARWQEMQQTGTKPAIRRPNINRPTPDQ